nr:MAG TPA: ferritin-like protein [Caudoviricetes sp.]
MKAVDKAMETISQNEKFDRARLSIAIREKINEENEAINSYLSLVPHIVDTEIKRIIEDIANEEKVHVGELQEILYSLDPNEKRKEREGRKENAL